jgi:hypothetical protein
MKPKSYLIIAIPLIMNLTAQAEMNFSEFIGYLFLKHEPEYTSQNFNNYKDFCNQFNIAVVNEDNKRKYLFLSFYHDCFTGESALDYSSGGFFRIPYFWHWVEPNPRHEIIFEPESLSLNQIKPPQRFNRYKSYADIDRTPSLFLSDLVFDTPRYYHPECGEFYTFGWCSEREMSFVLLMSLFNYTGKIHQSGIHVRSEFLVTFILEDSSDVKLIAEVDNTFNILNWKLPDSEALEDWENDFGEGESVRWYNQVAHSEVESRIVREIIVSETAAERLSHDVKDELMKDRR